MDEFLPEKFLQDRVPTVFTLLLTNQKIIDGLECPYETLDMVSKYQGEDRNLQQNFTWNRLGYHL